MKTAISLPDAVFRQAERAARRLKLTRSELFRRALQAFLEQQGDREITASYDAAFADAESPEEVRFRRRAVANTLRQVEWQE